MPPIDYLVYNTGISTGAGGTIRYRVVRYGVCDSDDLGGQAYEANDVAIPNYAGEVPAYYNDGAYGYYPYYMPSSGTLSTVQITELPPYDAATDPTNHRTQSSEVDATDNVLLKLFPNRGSFGLGGITGAAVIADFEAAPPPNGLYLGIALNGFSPTAGGPPDLNAAGTTSYLVKVSSIGTLKALFEIHQIDVPYRSWTGYRIGATGAVTWTETTPTRPGKVMTDYEWTTSGVTAGLWRNTIGAGAGTFSSLLPTLTTKYTSMKRSLYSSVATTLNQVIGQRQSERTFFRGVAASGMGGFYFNARFGFETWTNGCRFFAGLHTGTTVISADPSTLNNAIGFAVDAADNGLIYFQSKATGGASKVSTGLTIVSGKGYEIEVYCAPGGVAVDWKITDLNAGTVVAGTATAALPATTVGNALGVLASNGALTAVNAVQLGISKIYAKTEL